MTPHKRDRLCKAGWIIGNADDFLEHVMTNEELADIARRRNAWAESFDGEFDCQECGAGQDDYIQLADIDALITEVRRLRRTSMCRCGRTPTFPEFRIIDCCKDVLGVHE